MIPTVIIASLIFGAVIFIIVNEVLKRAKGQSTCGGNCGACGLCHKEKTEQ